MIKVATKERSKNNRSSSSSSVDENSHNDSEFCFVTESKDASNSHHWVLDSGSTEHLIDLTGVKNLS